jgi:hypothetical protein
MHAAQTRWFALGLLASCWALAGFAGDTDGWTVLFNGKDLTGWQVKGEKEKLDGKTEADNARFGVENGILVARAKDSKGGSKIRELQTVQEFDKDFRLKLEFRASPKSDSGVYLRGPQLQVRDFIRRGEKKHLKNFKNDDWNELDITVKGKTAECLINGEPLETMKNLPPKGRIGVQAETGKFEFRNLRIREEK